jgi:hypothetical protein
MGILLGLCMGSSNKRTGGRENAGVPGVPELFPALLPLKVYWKDLCAENVPPVMGTRRAGVSRASLGLFVNFGGDLERERARVKTRPGVDGRKVLCVANGVVCGGNNENVGNGGVTAAIASVWNGCSSDCEGVPLNDGSSCVKTLVDSGDRDLSSLWKVSWFASDFLALRSFPSSRPTPLSPAVYGRGSVASSPLVPTPAVSSLLPETSTLPLRLRPGSESLTTSSTGEIALPLPFQPLVWFRALDGFG